ncbi:hypothetical protein EVAR_71227_1 [Eumeta japonica]|uniref:RNase H type-1 domain-containing protein n=1 Tax=Eumeta variegata TaxID=151549 RepID=A0A4C1SW57_EUMVA|nr:hypothetical protein EVAR_71227_1 [Eumeta japonica]
MGKCRIISEKGIQRYKEKPYRTANQFLRSSKQHSSSSLVLECRNELNQLATQNHITLIWVLGHEEHSGNEMVDSYARTEAEWPLWDPPHLLDSIGTKLKG